MTFQIKHTNISYPKIITITSCGWRATVTKNIDNAGPNAIKMYPNSSTIVIFTRGNNKNMKYIGEIELNRNTSTIIFMSCILGRIYTQLQSFIQLYSSCNMMLSCSAGLRKNVCMSALCGTCNWGITYTWSLHYCIACIFSLVTKFTATLNGCRSSELNMSIEAHSMLLPCCYCI